LPKLGYNAVPCNLYRNGNDSVGLHADAEPKMGRVIASVSLAAERLFHLKRLNETVVFAEQLNSQILCELSEYGGACCSRIPAMDSKYRSNNEMKCGLWPSIRRGRCSRS
jgi:hypothetical protein